MFKINLAIGAASAVALAFLVPTGAAHAEDQDQVRSEAVFFGDLDLRTADGVETLDTRLNRAIKRVCGGSSNGPIGITRSVRECRAETAAKVRPARDLAINDALDRDNRLAQKEPDSQGSISFRSPE